MKEIKQILGIDRLEAIEAKTGTLLDKYGNQIEMARGIYMTDSYDLVCADDESRKIDLEKLVGTCGPRYQVYQYRDVKKRADEALHSAGIVPSKVEGFLTKGGASMRLRYTIDRPERDIPSREHWKLGEEFSAGIDFTTGHGGQQNAQAIKGHGFITRLACKNGMRSNQSEFSLSVKHFATEKVDARLSEDISNCLNGLGQVVTWFNKLHDVKITQRQGENILKNLHIDRGVCNEITSVWNHADEWIEVSRAGTPESYHLGNLYNVATQVLTHNGERRNIDSSTELSGRILDTFVDAQSSENRLKALMAPPRARRRKGTPQYGEHHGVGSLIQNN